MAAIKAYIHLAIWMWTVSFERQSATIGAAKAAVMHEHPGKWWLNVPPSCERAALRTHTHTFLCISVNPIKAFHVQSSSLVVILER